MSWLGSWNTKLLILIQFEAKVIPDDAALQVAAGNGEGHGVFAG
jgi:hypothetical protein